MITPIFEVSQDDEYIYVDIKAPYIKASLIQFEVNDDVFVFTLPPYYLRLRLPGFLIEDDKMTSSYDVKTSKIHCRVSKLNKGEHFEDLDMITKLLATKRQQQDSNNPRPLIQDLDIDGKSRPAHEIDPDFDWEIVQQLPSEESSTAMYGFNNQYNGKVGLSLHVGNEINELADPENETSEAKLRLMRETTVDAFDEEHYLADLYDDTMIKELIDFKFPRLSMETDLQDRITRLGAREYLISNLKHIYLGIIPLVFAWAYDFRTNLGEPTVESSWTVGKLTPAMCFLFNGYTNVQEVVKDCTARSLVKPLYRNWNLTLNVWKDTLNILKAGKSSILIVFARLLAVFENDLHGLYRQILLEDYTIWVQYASDKVLKGLTIELEKTLANMKKSDIYLPLEKVELLTTNSDSDDDSGSE